MLNILQVIIIIAIAPLISGVIAKLKNNLRMRKGASIFQPYYNFFKLFSKEEVISKDTSWIFRITPFVVLASSICASFLVPVFVPGGRSQYIGDLFLLVFLFSLSRFFLSLAALDSGSAFGGMGSSREMFISSLAEPVAILSIFAVCLNLGSTNLLAFNSLYTVKISTYISVISLMMVTLAETSRIPIDNQETHLELTMIHEAMVLEYSGRSLALIELSSYIKQIVLFSLISALFPLQFFHIAGISLAAYLIKISAICIIVALVEVSLAKMRLFRVADFLSFSFTLALIAIITAALGA